MHDIERMQRIAEYIYNDTDTRKWLFSHTYTQEEYMQVRRALKVLAEFHPVQWTGKTGERRPVECSNPNCINDRSYFQHDEIIETLVQGVLNNMPFDPEKIRLARETLTPAKRQNAIEYLDMLKDYTPQWMTERDHAFVTVMKEIVMYEEKDSTAPDVSKKDTPTTFKGKRTLNQLDYGAYWFLKERLNEIAKLSRDRQDVLKLVAECDDIIMSLRGDE